MKKFINTAESVAQETLEGYLVVHHDQFERLPVGLGLVKRHLTDKVGIVSGGGSGHEPVWLEYAGPGFADAIVQGDVFAAPAPPAIIAAGEAVDRGHGILFVYGNYSGDALNFDIAAEELEQRGHNVATVRITDDIASAPKSDAHLRRGIAGGFFTSKIAGAASAHGLKLSDVAEVAAAANATTGTIAVAAAGGTIPGKDEPTFELPVGMLEIGMGMHGEPGVRRGAMLPANELVDQMWDLLSADVQLDGNSTVALLVNGLGATTRAELFIIARRTCQRVAETGCQTVDFLVGNYATCQEMHGFSISVIKLDERLFDLYRMPGSTSFHGGRQ